MSVETFQDEWELELLVEFFEDLDPDNVLEIGAWHGGTLQHWMGYGRNVVVIDDEMRNAEEWGRWAEHSKTNLTLLQGISQDPELVEKAKDIGPYNFCFIDGDHRYEQVKADWDNFHGICDVVALHDIAPRSDYGVAQLWQEIKQQRKTIEIWAGVPEYCGIGVVWL